MELPSGLWSRVDPDPIRCYVAADHGEKILEMIAKV